MDYCLVLQGCFHVVVQHTVGRQYVLGPLYHLKQTLSAKLHQPSWQEQPNKQQQQQQ
jgi:hypothetical protein